MYMYIFSLFFKINSLVDSLNYPVVITGLVFSILVPPFLPLNRNWRYFIPCYGNSTYRGSTVGSNQSGLPDRYTISPITEVSPISIPGHCVSVLPDRVCVGGGGGG